MSNENTGNPFGDEYIFIYGIIVMMKVILLVMSILAIKK